MPSIENFLNARRDSVVFYKVNLLLDIEFESDSYNESNKLTSFFGQIGVYENSEKLLNLVKNLYKDLYFSFLLLKEKSDLEEQNESFKMFFKPEEKIFNYDNNIEEVFNENCDVKQNIENEENEQDEGEIEDENEEYFFFFLPLIMIFYRGDRKMDYFLGNEFKEKLFFKKKTVVFKEKLNLKKFLKKNFFFKKNYKKNFFFKKFNKNKKNFFNVIKNNNIVFIVKDFLKYHFFDIKNRVRLKKKKRFRMFKKLKLKFKSKILYLCKDNKWWSSTYVLFLLNLKYFFLSSYYSHKNYLTGVFNFFSQMINIKKKFFKRYRRKRKFKRDFFRNFFGKRAKLNIVLNIIEDEKKKKGKKKK